MIPSRAPLIGGMQLIPGHSARPRDLKMAFEFSFVGRGRAVGSDIEMLGAGQPCGATELIG